MTTATHSELSNVDYPEDEHLDFGAFAPNLPEFAFPNVVSALDRNGKLKSDLPAARAEAKRVRSLPAKARFDLTVRANAEHARELADRSRQQELEREQQEERRQRSFLGRTADALGLT